MNPVIEISDHALGQMVERGVARDEVLAAIAEGDIETARRGRLLYRKNFPFNRAWKGRVYRTKQVAPVVAKDDDKLIIVTVYAYYF